VGKYLREITRIFSIILYFEEYKISGIFINNYIHGLLQKRSGDNRINECA